MKSFTPSCCGRMLIKLLIVCGVGISSACVEHTTTEYVPGYYSTTSNSSQGRYYRDNDYYSSKSGTRNNYSQVSNHHHSHHRDVPRVYSRSSRDSSDEYYSSKESQVRDSGDGSDSNSQRQVSSQVRMSGGF